MTAGIIVGIGLTLAALALVIHATDKGWKMAWWQWLLLALAGPIFLYGVAMLGTSIAEGTIRAGWILFGLATVVALILGFAALRPIRAS